MNIDFGFLFLLHYSHALKLLHRLQRVFHFQFKALESARFDMILLLKAKSFLAFLHLQLFLQPLHFLAILDTVKLQRLVSSGFG